MISITSSQLKILAPNARSSYREAFTTADAVLAGDQINTSPLQVAHFMAQLLHECGALTILEENLNYSAKRMPQVWPKRFPTEADAEPYAHDPEKLANTVYGGRMGNVDPGDGWKYRGRGLLQLTGRESYEKYGKLLGIDLAGNPDFATDSRYCLRIAAAEWKASGCNAFADADDVKKVTKAINGGTVGLAERTDWLKKTKAVWLPKA